MPPNDEFNFDDPASASEARTEKRQHGGRSSTKRGNAKWTDMVSGLGPMQWGVIFFFIASLFMFYRLQAIPAERESVGYVLITFLVSLLLFIVGEGCLLFGHMSAGKAPDSTSNTCATASLLLSLLSGLGWLAYLGSLLYVFAQPRDALIGLQVAMGGFCLGILAGLGAELAFSLGLRRAGSILKDSKLQSWGVVMIALFGVALAINCILWIIFFMAFLGAEGVIGFLLRAGVSATVGFAIELALFLFVLVGSMCYWYTLKVAKWTLTNPPGARGRVEEDAEDEIEERRGRRDSEEHDDRRRPSRRRSEDDNEDERPRRRRD